MELTISPAPGVEEDDQSDGNAVSEGAGGRISLSSPTAAAAAVVVASGEQDGGCGAVRKRVSGEGDRDV
jgi:hypothetical protein